MRKTVNAEKKTETEVNKLCVDCNGFCKQNKNVVIHSCPFFTNKKKSFSSRGKNDTKNA